MSNNMSEQSILELIKSGTRIVDVRSENEYQTGHYKNAENIDVDLILSGVADFGTDFNASVILYCVSGKRSEAAAVFLKSKGYINVMNAGGLKDMPVTL